MARNPVQFQKGISWNEFLSLYGTEDQCFDALYQWRWPNGFVCPHCGHDRHCQLTSRKLQQYHRCHRQTSITAGTIFDSTKLALTVWFQLRTAVREPTRCPVRRRSRGPARRHPGTSQPLRPILGQRFRQIHRQRQRRLVQDGRGASLARPQYPVGDQTLPDPLVVVRRGRHQSGDRRPSIEDLNLTATAHHAQIAGEIRLQVGDGCGSHRDQYGLRSGTIQVSNRVLRLMTSRPSEAVLLPAERPADRMEVVPIMPSADGPERRRSGCPGSCFATFPR